MVCDKMCNFVEAFVTQPGVVELCSEWVVLAVIAVTIAVGTASPERSFSILNLVKTRLRNRLSQPMLDALLRINLSLDFSDLLSMLPDIARKWITASGRREDFGDGGVPEKYGPQDAVPEDSGQSGGPKRKTSTSK